MGNRSTRRSFISGIGAAGALAVGSTGLASASSSFTLERQFLDYRGNPIPHATINAAYFYRDESGSLTLERFNTQTDAEGWIQRQLPAGGGRLSGAFYKSSESAYLAPRLDGVPHIHILDAERVDDEGTDSGAVQLPEAHTLDARAVFAGRPGGVEDATPRFGSLRSGGYWASGYSYTTTDADGYMKLNNADFTGVEMAGRTKLWMYAPTFEAYEEQQQHDYAPYEKVDVQTIDVTEDMTVEADISRRPTRGGGQPGR